MGGVKTGGFSSLEIVNKANTPCSFPQARAVAARASPLAPFSMTKLIIIQDFSSEFQNRVHVSLNINNASVGKRRLLRLLTAVWSFPPLNYIEYTYNLDLEVTFLRAEMEIDVNVSRKGLPCLPFTLHPADSGFKTVDCSLVWALFNSFDVFRRLPSLWVPLLGRSYSARCNHPRLPFERTPIQHPTATICSSASVVHFADSIPSTRLRLSYIPSNT